MAKFGKHILPCLPLRELQANSKHWNPASQETLHFIHAAHLSTMEQPAEPTFYRTQVGNAERLRAPIQKSRSPSSTYTCQDGLPTFSLPGPPWLEQLSKEAENKAACPAGFLVCYSRSCFPQPWASALASGP